METVSGKAVTIPVSSRLTITNYQKIKEIAKRQQLTMSKLISGWIEEKLKENNNGHSRIDPRTN